MIVFTYIIGRYNCIIICLFVCIDGICLHLLKQFLPVVSSLFEAVDSCFFALKDSECGVNKFFISFNLCLVILVSFMAIHPRVQEGMYIWMCTSFVENDVNGNSVHHGGRFHNDQTYISRLTLENGRR